jgi:hypothetical protein
MRPEGLSLKNASDHTWNQTRDIPVCIAVPLLSLINKIKMTFISANTL